MKSCSLSEFKQVIEPWLSEDYIHKVCLEGKSRLKVFFNDGVSNVYRIDNCTEKQLEDILSDMKEKGIDVDG
jgi:hypothetical protein